MNPSMPLPPSQSRPQLIPQRHEIDFQCPVEYRIVHHIELSHPILNILNRLISILENLMTEQELKDYGAAKAQEVVDVITTAVTAEHDEILAAIAAKAGLSDEQVKAAFDASTESLKSKVADLIGGVFTPDAVVPVPGPTPTDGGTPPVPTDGGTPPVPTDGGTPPVPTDGGTPPVPAPTP